MSYFKSPDEAQATLKVFHDENKCFLCGKDLCGPTVEYMGYLMGGTTLMHRDCAFAMANRIIADCWPNRRDDQLMKCDK